MFRKREERDKVAVDFDGVLNRYDTPFEKAWIIPDRPVDGAISWLFSVNQEYDVVIFSCRADCRRGRNAIREWLKTYSGTMWYSMGKGGYVGLEEVVVTNRKPHARIYVDDRGWRFNGPNTFPTLREIRELRRWNKRD